MPSVSVPQTHGGRSLLNGGILVLTHSAGRIKTHCSSSSAPAGKSNTNFSYSESDVFHSETYRKLCAESDAALIFSLTPSPCFRLSEVFNLVSVRRKALLWVVPILSHSSLR